MPQKNDRNRHDDRIVPNPLLSEVKVLGAMPAMVLRYALDEEQTLFDFEMSGVEVFVREEKHYRIVTDEDLMGEEAANDRSVRMDA